MKISTKGRYALRMLLDLAEHQSEGYIALKDIAARQDVSKKYLEQIIPILNKSYVHRREVCHRLPVWTMSRYSVREPTYVRHFPYGKD